jgi:hypothetical protein
MRRSRSKALAAALACAAILSCASALRAQTLLTSEEAAKSVALEKIEVTPAGVSGIIVNKTPHIVRNVEVLVQYHWLWENEFKPGTNSPGQTATVRLNQELQPGQSAPFRHALDAGADRKDGRFLPEVMIGGFTVVTPVK